MLLKYNGRLNLCKVRMKMALVGNGSGEARRENFAKIRPLCHNGPMDARQKKLIIFFFVICLLALLSPWLRRPISSADAPATTGPRQSFLRDVNYYVVDKLGRAEFFLATDELQWDLATNARSAVPAHGQIFRVMDDPIQFAAEEASIEADTGTITLQGQAALNTTDSSLAAHTILYNQKKSLVQALGEVKSWKILPKTKDRLSISAPSATGDVAQQDFAYTQGVEGEITFKRKYLAPVFFKAQEVQFKRQQMLVHLQDQVELAHKNVKVSAWQGEIYLANYHDGGAYYTLSHNVHLRETNPPQKNYKHGKTARKDVGRQAFAEQLEGWPREGKIVLTGLPKLMQDNSLIKGRKVTLYQDRELVEVEDATSGLKLNDSEAIPES